MSGESPLLRLCIQYIGLTVTVLWCVFLILPDHVELALLFVHSVVVCFSDLTFDPVICSGAGAE